MAFGDMFKNNMATGVAIGLGAALLAPAFLPAAARVARPAAKTVIKSSIVAYERARETLAELGEMAEDTYAEARAEMNADAKQAATAAGAASMAGETANAGAADPADTDRAREGGSHPKSRTSEGSDDERGA